MLNVVDAEQVAFQSPIAGQNYRCFPVMTTGGWMGLVTDAESVVGLGRLTVQIVKHPPIFHDRKILLNLTEIKRSYGNIYRPDSE